MAPASKSLRKQERFCLDTMENVLHFMHNYNEEQDKFQIEGWKTRLNEVFSHFQSIRLKLELIDDEEEGEENEEAYRKVRDSFEKNYVKAIGFLAAADRKANPPVPPAVASGATQLNPNPIVTRIKLPEVKLPSFDGTITEWLSFRDSFKSLIDSNPNLSDVDKLSYLVGSLTNDAKRIVESIEITSANYSVAWELLQKRFDNKKLVVKTYLDSLFSIEPIKRECYDSLVQLIDAFERNLKMVNKMEIDTEGWSILLAHMVYSRLDSSTLKQWENHHKSTEVPEYRNLIEFLRGHAMVLQSISPTKARNLDTPSSARTPKSKISSTHSVVSSPPKPCPFCKQALHSIFKCDAFRNYSVSERYELVKRKALCINCLSPDHQVKACSSSTCRVCGQKHHTMLHIQNSNRNSIHSASKQNPSPPNSEQTQIQTPIAKATQAIQNQTHPSVTVGGPSVPVKPPSLSHCSTSLIANSRPVPSTVLLQTALVKVIDSNGYSMWARALLDPASQINVISERLVQRLRTRKIKDHHTIGGIGKTTTVSTHSVLLRICSRCMEFSADLKFHILSEITRELPSNAADTTDWEWPSEIVLADPKFHEPSTVDMIIGMESYYDLLLEGLVKLGPGKPVLQNTVFGWVVSGKVGVTHPFSTTIVAHVCSTQSIEDQLARFWEIESCESSSTMSVEESACEAHFSATTIRDETGRFVVTLPKRIEVLEQLGDSYPTAKRRLLSLNRRLEANPTLKSAYLSFLEEYLQLGHMEEVSQDPLTVASYYLPHHYIVRPESLTTKLRVVFDASCATDTGVSLNDVLMVGPVVQEDLVCITMRFRVPKYAIISDIEKMYRQIWVQHYDCPLQRILWQDKLGDPMRIFQLKTVTYGTSAAPYLATKCLQELAKQGQSSHPAAANVLAHDFYMDDMISGVNDVGEGKVLCSQLLELLQSAGFSLRKWASNSPEILEHIPAHLRDERSVLDLDSTSSVKTLGLKWIPRSDELGFHVPEWNNKEVITKRIALSDSARLYDPLGLVGPVIILAKCFMQELWAYKITWDEPLDEKLQQRWLHFRKELASIETITVPRWVIPIPQPVIIEAHGFSDASQRAYGACIYLRVVSSNGEISVHLLTSKSKVAPMGNSKGQKKISLPRLELSSALLLSHLFQKVQHSLKLDLKCFYWVDSTIVLHWLAGTPSRWKTFVANRISEIQHITARGSWGHVSGLENPADIISRGMLPTQLKHMDIWWHGPKWLKQSPRFWPSHIRTADHEFPSEDLEERSTTLTVQNQPPDPIFTRRSSFPSLVRLVAYLRRFCHNCKPSNRQNQLIGFLRTTELNEAIHALVRIAQAESFANDLKAIRSSGQVKSNSKLKSLSPIIIDGILRVGGRLRNAPVSEDRKHPIILAAHHPFTELVITSYHEKLLHAGPQLLIASIREKFWPLRVRNLARKVVHDCLKCFRCKPTALEQIMGDLPAERVTPTFPFYNTGVDLCGPLFYRHTLRKSSPIKCYVAIFVCLATKGMHIELVADLSTNAFVMALKRFVARRGRPAVIECDNAKNFLGTSRTLAELHDQFRSQQHKHAVTTYCGEEGIHFKFIPPRSPNFGGLWEAAVKSFKKHLKATIGITVLLKDDLETILTQIESCLNSRPLTQITSDPEDLEILTPGHFLVHRPLGAIPEPSYEEVPKNRLDRYQQIQEFVRRIWKRWSTDYLSGLHPRTKWTRLRDNIAIGTMVLLKDENLPPLKWRFGRVTQIFRGDDGNVRVVSVRTQDGEYRRAITKVCVLPVQHPAPAVTHDLLSEM